MILTHFDKDHVGGADHILQGIPVEQVLEPDYAGSGKQYREYADTKENAGEVRAVTAEETFSFAGATVTVYPSALTLEDILDSGEKEYDNDLSLAVRLVDEDNTFWFLGDAQGAPYPGTAGYGSSDWRLPGAESSPITADTVPRRGLFWRR